MTCNCGTPMIYDGMRRWDCLGCGKVIYDKDVPEEGGAKKMKADIVCTQCDTFCKATLILGKIKKLLQDDATTERGLRRSKSTAGRGLINEFFHELKTLKDMTGLPNKWNPGFERFGLKGEFTDYTLVKKDELRQEAIKWIKKLDEECKLIRESPEKRSYLIESNAYAVPWIKHFFNITEEDLR